MSNTATKEKPNVPTVTPPAKDAPKDELMQVLDKYRGQVAAALPKHLTPERVIRMAVTTVRRSPELAKCDVMSILSCVIQASELGLELTGPLGQAYMIPRRNKHNGNKLEATFQVGYKGYVRLAFNSGLTDFFSAHAVHAKDFFEYQYGTDQRLVHRPADGDRGPVTHFYSVLKMKGGASDFEVMSRVEMEKHRDRFRSAKGGPWDTDFIAMGCKTMIRKLAKRAPLSPELAIAVQVDEDEERKVAEPLLTGPMIDLPIGREKLTDETPEDPPATKDDGEIVDAEFTVTDDADAGLERQDALLRIRQGLKEKELTEKAACGWVKVAKLEDATAEQLTAIETELSNKRT